MEPPFDISADLDTPVSTYLKLGPLEPRYLLESVEGGAHLARYSFLGFGAVSQFRLDGSGMHVNGEQLPRPESTESLLTTLRRMLDDTPSLQPTVPDLPFSGGLVGIAGYDLVRHFERLERAPDGPAIPESPEAAYVATESLLIFDHLTRRIALLHSGTEDERLALRDAVIQLLRGPLPPARPSAGYSDPVQSLSAEEFKQAVALSKEYIAKGDIYQIVLSVRFSGKHRLSPFETYRAMRLVNPSPYMFFFDLGDLQVAGSSPEALVKCHGGQAALRPIAGTRPRGQDDAEDRANEASLLADVKENAEHVMLVDLARNDLGRVAAAGSVHVEPYKSIERYSHVMHIVSGVQGTLAAGKDAFDLFAAAFPAGTLVGAPKVRAMQLIDAMEPVRRGIYAGTVGYFGTGGDMDHAIAIRTLVFNDDEYSFQAGAGIVADSVPQTEYEEVLAKSAILRRALAIAEEGLSTAQPRLLLIDNYDSFTYNLVQAFLVLGADVEVYRNDQITVADARRLSPTHLCISPGPGRPEDAGVSLDMIAAFESDIPIFGVCLGHQSLVQHFGGRIISAERLMHGKTSMVEHDGKTIYAGLSQPFEAGRYHSLAAEAGSVPAVLEVTAQTSRGEIMGVRHRELPIEGVQFHPESVLTPEGDALMKNFLQLKIKKNPRKSA